MTIPQFLKQTNLSNSVLLGYYGGGNYGDELLLEVLQNLLSMQGRTAISIAYQHPENFRVMHKDFGYKPFNIHSKLTLLRTTLKHKNIIIGGGGLWGVDMNSNTFMLSIFLFVARFLLGKRVYLVGVGYYNSTTRLGHLGAWFAGHAANHIIVRDDESFANFSKLSKATTQDKDIAFYISELNLKTYADELKDLEKILPADKPAVFIALRRFRHPNDFSKVVGELIAANSKINFVLALLELETVDRGSAAQIMSLKKKHRNVRSLTSPCNPLALYAYFHKHKRKLAVIAPQFHLILTAHLAGVPFMPIVYDNKVSQLLSMFGVSEDRQLAVGYLTTADAQIFIDQFFKG